MIEELIDINNCTHATVPDKYLYIINEGHEVWLTLSLPGFFNVQDYVRDNFYKKFMVLLCLGSSNGTFLTVNYNINIKNLNDQVKGVVFTRDSYTEEFYVIIHDNAGNKIRHEYLCTVLFANGKTPEEVHSPFANIDADHSYTFDIRDTLNPKNETRSIEYIFRNLDAPLLRQIRPLMDELYEILRITNRAENEVMAAAYTGTLLYLPRRQ